MTPEKRLARLLDAERAGDAIDLLAFWGHTPEGDGSVSGTCLSQWWGLNLLGFALMDVRERL